MIEHADGVACASLVCCRPLTRSYAFRRLETSMSSQSFSSAWSSARFKASSASVALISAASHLDKSSSVFLSWTSAWVSINAPRNIVSTRAQSINRPVKLISQLIIFTFMNCTCNTNTLITGIIVFITSLIILAGKKWSIVYFSMNR